jgi:restriction system protein
MTKTALPDYPTLFSATFAALKRLGGSASNDELYEQVVSDLHLPPSALEVPHPNSNVSELEYRLAWARTYLRIAGYIANSGRGVWSFTPDANKTQSVDGKEILKTVRARSRSKPAKGSAPTEVVETATYPAATEEESVDSETWREILMETLLALSPAAFERLAQRLLRESGFTQVEVTGRSGDGGIDGHGIVRVAGLLSFPVLFQCKRWKGNVPPSTVRDFRGAMVGRADKGLIITTGTFSLEARREATRDGAPPIDIVDGESLMEKLRELGLGIVSRTITVPSVDKKWFEGV